MITQSRWYHFVHLPIFKLYISYGLSCFGEQLWMFALGLIMMRIGAMRLVATNLVVNSVAVMLFASSVGKWIDAKPRLSAAQTLLTTNNLAIALSGCFFALPMALSVDMYSSIISFGLVIVAVLFCGVAIVAMQGSKIVLAKDWVVIMSNDDQDVLAERNAMLVRIDLAVSIAAPLLAGILMSVVGPYAGCMLVIAWHLISLPIELWMVRRAYDACPRLAKKTIEIEKQMEILENRSPAMSFLYEEKAKVEMQSTPVSNCKPCKVRQALTSFFDGWKIYRRQSVFPAALGLALLYLTVLGFDSVTLGFAMSQGLPEAVLSWAYAFACIIGIVATLTFPTLRRRIGVVRTGSIALAVEVTFLILAILSVWLPGSPFDPIGYYIGSAAENATLNATLDNSATVVPSSETLPSASSLISISVLLCGILLARFGLWTADLAITQIMQESVSIDERGTVFGVQSSMNFLFDLMKNLLVFALPDPKTFGLLIIFSVAAVFAGFLSFCVYRSQVRRMSKLPSDSLEPSKGDAA